MSPDDHLPTRPSLATLLHDYATRFASLPQFQQALYRHEQRKLWLDAEMALANPATTNLETFLAIAQEIALADMLLARLNLARTTITDLRNYVEGELFRIKLLGAESDYSAHLANKLLDIDAVLKDITL